MAKNIHSGHRARLRQTMRQVGLENMQPHQVLEYLLSFVVARKDTNPIAHRLIDYFGSYSAVFEASADELMQVDGVGEVTAVFLSSMLSFNDYYLKNRTKKINYINNSVTAILFMQSLLTNKPNEQFFVAVLDSAGKVIDSKKLGDGSRSKLNVFIRDITKFALSHNATQVVVGHNHPDEDKAEPSAEDNIFTDNLNTALKPNGINLLDHIIVAKHSCYSSFAGYDLDEATLKKYKKSGVGIHE